MTTRTAAVGIKHGATKMLAYYVSKDLEFSINKDQYDDLMSNSLQEFEGDPGEYVEIDNAAVAALFAAFDGANGGISALDLICGLAAVSSGTAQEKLSGECL